MALTFPLAMSVWTPTDGLAGALETGKMKNPHQGVVALGEAVAL